VKITKEQLIEIAKAGFPLGIQKSIDFENLDIVQQGDKFALFNRSKKFDQEGYYLSVIFRTDFIQFYTGTTLFNQMAGISKMLELNLIIK